MTPTKLNERVWAGQLVGSIKEIINQGNTVFQEVTNDEGVKLVSGTTKFPDILLFIDKVSGIIFNGWELKFPDTASDDPEMLINALEKAEQIKANSFVTWNGKSAIIWQIEQNNYTLDGLRRLKTYPDEVGINNRNDLSDRNNYQRFEGVLTERLHHILHDLEQLYFDGEIKAAINVSDEIITAIEDSSQYLIPLISDGIRQAKNDIPEFRRKFNEWKVLESSTLRILANSSRRIESIEPEEVLAKFTFYKLISKIIFYSTLAENLSTKIQKIRIIDQAAVLDQLDTYFQEAHRIDYHAVFGTDFTDLLRYPLFFDEVLYRLLTTIGKYDLQFLPNSVIGNILQNLVPPSEKQKFGQYFTPELLAFFVTFPAINNNNDYVFDPTSGTGTFLSVSYNILNYLGKISHQDLLNQIWGNDISHFPAILSVINLYKQQVSDTENFPRVIRSDFFTLTPGQVIQFPDNININQMNQIQIPFFDSIVSNFPFIQQEDIPTDDLSAKFRIEFGENQNCFIDASEFKINERSDYYVYCFYNSLKFLKNNGNLSVITSNAWLGKNYGMQFKRFLLDNFSIKYLVQSDAEHWFKDSKVSTIFIVLTKGHSEECTKFVTVRKKLDELFAHDTSKDIIQSIEDFYSQIDHCDNPRNSDWNVDNIYPTVFHRNDGSSKVSIISRQTLINSLANQENWSGFFYAEDILSMVRTKLINPNGSYITSGRGTRTGWDDMFIISREDLENSEVEGRFLLPILKSNQTIKSILDESETEHFLFSCEKSEDEMREAYPNAYRWIKAWEVKRNEKGESLKTVFKRRKPYWYSLFPEDPANIYISINPDKRLFFSYSEQPKYLNQRFAAIRTSFENAPLIAALLNSITTLLVVESNGISRNLGALDLNADFMKSKLHILNPGLLSNTQKDKIITAFSALNRRDILSFDLEFTQRDRITFDEVVLSSFGCDPRMLPHLYGLLNEKITNRTQMKYR